MLIYLLMVLDMEEYLPSKTKDWCQQKIKDMGYPNGFLTGEEFNHDKGCLHQEVYLNLY